MMKFKRNITTTTRAILIILVGCYNHEGAS